MKLISSQYKFVLITVPKNACVTFRFWFDYNEKNKLEKLEALEARPPGNIHTYCRRRYTQHPIKSNYKAFVVIRNPWTRLASAYFDKIVRSKWLKKLEIKSINEFITFLSLIDVNGSYCNEHWKSQHSFIADININDFLQVEYAQQDSERMADIIGVKKITLPNWKKNSNTKKKYTNLYSKQEARAIGELYKKDKALADYECPDFMIDNNKKSSLVPTLLFRAKVLKYLIGLRIKYYNMMKGHIFKKIASNIKN